MSVIDVIGFIILLFFISIQVVGPPLLALLITIELCKPQ